MNKYRILLADFDLEIMFFYAKHLENSGFEVKTSSNGIDAWNKAMVFHPDVIILDLMNTEQLGLKVCKQIKTSMLLKNVATILHTSVNEESLNHSVLKAFVDEILQKPVMPELMERAIHNVVKTIVNGHTTRNILDFDNLSIDLESYSVTKAGISIELAKREFDLLLLFASKPGKLFTRKEIIDHIWNGKENEDDRILDVYIAKLRSKIGKELIHTRKGVGYSLVITA
ncbi:MAG: response regulator transcription factor [Bacteroidales bacterium]|nr:response regulator transcription factor [Bacteroidales bacterium]